MRNIAVLTIFAVAAFVVVMWHAGPAYAAQATAAVSNMGQGAAKVVGTQSPVGIQLAKSTGHSVGMRSTGVRTTAIRTSGVRSSRVLASRVHSRSIRSVPFHSSRLVRHRHFRHVRPFVIGSIYAPYSYSYDTCAGTWIWDGYRWRCYYDDY